MKALTKQKDGRFVRNLGPTGGQRKFYLGRDERDALLRVAQLEKLWEWRKQSCWELDEDPSWDDLSFMIAKAIAAGWRSITVDVDAPPDLAVGIVSGIREVVPHIEINLSDKKAQEEGERYFREEAAKLRALADHFTLVEGNQKLSEAISAYVQAVEDAYRLGSGAVSEWGQVKVRQIKYVQEHAPAIRLAQLDAEEIDKLIRVIASRPPRSRDSEPISPSWAKATIKELRKFLRWLHKAKEFIWRLPDDYEVEPVRVALNDGERAKIGPFVETYSRKELAVLWMYATPWERCLMILAMNCGFGMAEIGTLRKDEVFPNQPHPFADQLDLKDKGDASWIRRNRAKTLSYGEWILWPETVLAINWIVEHRPTSNLPYIVVSQQGRPLKEEGKRNSRIANLWNALTRRVRKDQPQFPRRSFNKLRKTSSNFIRLEWGDGIADLFLAHGSPPANHKHLHHYTNPRFARLHEAILWLGGSLKEIFDKVAEPFPPSEKKGGANISLGRIQMIHDLHEKGVPIDLIAERVNVSKDTVRRRLAAAK